MRRDVRSVDYRRSTPAIEATIQMRGAHLSILYCEWVRVWRILQHILPSIPSPILSFCGMLNDATGPKISSFTLLLADVDIDLLAHITHPLIPTLAGCYGGDGDVHTANCVIYNGPVANCLGVEICFCSSTETITVVDASVKASPVELSRTTYASSGYTHQG
jgi:hypothetical protein